jgi:hypothetical protein
MSQEAHITTHAIERYQERVDPHASWLSAHLAIRRLLTTGRSRPTPRHSLLDYEKRGAWNYGANRELTTRIRPTSRFVPTIAEPFSVVDRHGKVIKRFKTRGAAERAARELRAASGTYYQVGS